MINGYSYKFANKTPPALQKRDSKPMSPPISRGPDLNTWDWNYCPNARIFTSNLLLPFSDDIAASSAAAPNERGLRTKFGRHHATQEGRKKGGPLSGKTCKKSDFFPPLSLPSFLPSFLSSFPLSSSTLGDVLQWPQTDRQAADGWPGSVLTCALPPSLPRSLPRNLSVTSDLVDSAESTLRVRGIENWN